MDKEQLSWNNAKLECFPKDALFSVWIFVLRANSHSFVSVSDVPLAAESVTAPKRSLSS